MPKIGQPAPDFAIQSTQGPISLSQFRGQWVVLFAHPADFTPVCTTEFIGFAQLNDQFKALNTQLIGLSVDGIYSHIAWLRDIKQNYGIEIPFPVLADTDKEVANLYDLVDEASGLTIRGVFVIDPEGILRFSAYYPIELGRWMEEFVRVVKALQAVDRNGTAAPANWQPGQPMIVPAPKTLEDSYKRDGADGAETWYLAKRSV